MTKVRSMSDARDSSVVEHLPQNSAESGLIQAEAAHVVVSAGSLLRQAREAAGLHIAALAVSLKVPVKKLEALEADRFDLLPDAVFVRALASSVCRNLKIDTAPILERLPRTSNPNLAYQGTGINTPFRAAGDGPGPSIWAQVSRPAVLAGLVLLFGALVLVLLPTIKTGVDVNSPDAALKAMNTLPSMLGATEVVAETVFPPASATRPPVSTVSLSSTDVGSSKSVSVSTLPSMAASSSSLQIPVLQPSAMQALVLPASPASAVASVTSTGIVVFTAKGTSWVEVTDSKGVVVLRRTLSAGEVAGASGALPLAAIVGRADATQVQIRGNAFDMSAVAKDNVARFEVK